MVKIAVMQMTSGIDPEENFAVIEQAAKDASEGEAEILFTPEMSLLLDKNRDRARHWVESEQPNDFVERLIDLSAKNWIDIALGSMPVSVLERGVGKRWHNRSYYFSEQDGSPAGVLSYDKIHMFDVELISGETWRESSAYLPGKHVVTNDDTAVGKLGFTICYDLRFPALFEELGRRRCDAIAVPAAFTKPTGEAHWHILLRARAIEASAFVIAAAQVGSHEDGRETYGHSLVVDPWGDVLLDMGGEGPGLAFCDIDLGRISEVRSQLPSLANKRDIPK